MVEVWSYLGWLGKALSHSGCATTPTSHTSFTSHTTPTVLTISFTSPPSPVNTSDKVCYFPKTFWQCQYLESTFLETSFLYNYIFVVPTFIQDQHIVKTLEKINDSQLHQWLKSITTTCEKTTFLQLCDDRLTYRLIEALTHALRCLDCHSSQKHSMCPTMQWQVARAIFSTFKEPSFQTKQAKGSLSRELPSGHFICL